MLLRGQHALDHPNFYTETGSIAVGALGTGAFTALPASTSYKYSLADATKGEA